MNTFAIWQAISDAPTTWQTTAKRAAKALDAGDLVAIRTIVERTLRHIPKDCPWRGRLRTILADMDLPG